MQREVRRVMGDVKKDRLIGVFRKRLVHEMQRVIGKHIGGVPFLIGMQMVHGRLGAGQHNLIIKKHRAMFEHGKVGIDEIARAIKAIEPARDG